MRVLLDIALLAVLIALAAVTRSAALYYLAGSLFVLGLFARRPSRWRHQPPGR